MHNLHAEEVCPGTAQGTAALLRTTLSPGPEAPCPRRNDGGHACHRGHEVHRPEGDSVHAQELVVATGFAFPKLKEEPGQCDALEITAEECEAVSLPHSSAGTYCYVCAEQIDKDGTVFNDSDHKLEYFKNGKM